MKGRVQGGSEGQLKAVLVGGVHINGLVTEDPPLMIIVMSYISDQKKFFTSYSSTKHRLLLRSNVVTSCLTCAVLSTKW